MTPWTFASIPPRTCQAWPRCSRRPDRAAAADASVEQVVTQLQDHVQSVHRELRFKVDENTGQTVVRVVDQETGRLIRQIPNQNVLDLNAFLQSISGLLLREQA
jgi:flagellar protein FlaG